MTRGKIGLAVFLAVVLGFAVLLQATVNEVTARSDYVANGATTAFTYGFKIFTKIDIEVLVNGVVKTVDTDYTVTGLGLSGGGTVTFTVAPANGLAVTLLRKQPAQQTSVYQTGALSATRLEQDFDKLQMQVQQLKEQLQRIPAFEKKSLLKDKVLPDFGAGKFLRANDAGTALEWVSPVTVGTLNVPSFTTGSVPFATGTATLGQDNANFFWDDANNRLGIGNAAPTEPLDVTGNIKGSGTLAITGASTLIGSVSAGAIATTGTLSSTKACATGYTRVLPNYCVRATLDSAGFTDTVACTSLAVSGTAALPADAKMAKISLLWDTLSNNATGIRQNTISFFGNSSCSTANGQVDSAFSLREEVAVAAGTSLGTVRANLIIPLSGTNTTHFTQSTAGGNGNADIVNFRVEGYFD